MEHFCADRLNESMTSFKKVMNNKMFPGGDRANLHPTSEHSKIELIVTCPHNTKNHKTADSDEHDKGV